MTHGYQIEINERVLPTERYCAALDTPLDQIPLTLNDLHRLAHQIDAAIKTIEGFSEKEAA